MFASESSIPAASTPLTGMDSFISISGTFPCSWFSKRSSEEGESKRSSFGIFPARFRRIPASFRFGSGINLHLLVELYLFICMELRLVEFCGICILAVLAAVSAAVYGGDGGSSSWFPTLLVC